MNTLSASDRKRVFAYTRVSKMNEGKLSTGMQTAEIERFCEFNGYELVRVYSDEDLSGSETSHRVSFNEMFEDIENENYGKIDMVVSYNISRFSRSVIDLNTYVVKLKKELNCDFRTVQESFVDTSSSMGTFLLNIFASVAQLERDRLIDVISDSNVNRAKNGGRWSNGGIVPYGYMKQGNTIVPNPQTAPIVKEIFRLYVEEDFLKRSIVVKFNEEGINPDRDDADLTKYRKDKRLNEIGKPVVWNPSRISRILENPAYIGVNVTNRRERTKTENNFNTHKKKSEYDWVWSNNFKITRLDEEFFWNSDFEILQYDFEPIIDIDTFVKAQKKIKEYNKWDAKREEVKYLLTGGKRPLLYCGECGKRMNGKRNDRDGKVTYYYYACNGKITNHTCNMKTVRTEVVDNYVLAVLSEKVVMSQVYQIVSSTDNDKTEYIEKYNKEKTLLEKQVKACEKAIDGLLDLVKSGLLNDTVKERTISDLNAEQRKKEETENKIKILTREFNYSVNKSVDYMEFYDKWLNYDFSDLSVETLREFLDEWVERVVYYNPEHIDIYLKFSKDKIEFDEVGHKMVKYKLRKMKRHRIKNEFINKITPIIDEVAHLENGIISGFKQFWQYANEPLCIHLHTTTKNTIIIIITKEKEKPL